MGLYKYKKPDPFEPGKLPLGTLGALIGELSTMYHPLMWLSITKSEKSIFGNSIFKNSSLLIEHFALQEHS